MRRNNFLALVSIISFFCSSAQHNSFASASFDSLDVFITKSFDQAYVEASLNKIHQNAEIVDPENIKKAYAILEASIRNSYKPGEAKANYLLGVQWRVLSDNSRSLDHLFRAIELYHSIGDLQGEAESYRALGETYRASVYHIFSLKYLRIALSMFEELKDYEGSARTYNRIAATYWEIYGTKDSGLYNRIIEEKELRHIFQTHNSFQMALVDSVRKYVNLSKRVMPDNKELLASNYNILGVLHTSINQRDSAYYFLKKALRIREDFDLTHEIPLVLFNMANMMKEESRYEEAIKNSRRGLLLAQNNGSKIYAHLNANLLAQCYENIGNYYEAYKYRTISHNYTIQIYNDDLKLKAYTAQLDLERALSKEKLESEKKSRLYQSLIFSLSMFLTLTLIFALSWRYKKNKKINRELELKNAQINVQKEELFKTNASKDKLFSVVAHDLRTPLTALLGLADILYEDYEEMTDSEKKKFICEITSSIQELYNLSTNLLNWAALQLQKASFEPAEINYREVLLNVIKLLEFNAAKKKIKIINNIHEDLDITADKDMLQSITLNLISNAIKFSNTGGKIEIKADFEPDSLIVSVIDYGVGIDEKKLGELFKFSAAKASRGTLNERGTGLGLLICKEMIEKHNGEIWVESKINKGSSFHFKLPLKYKALNESFLNSYQQGLAY